MQVLTMARVLFLLLIPAPAGISQILDKLQERKAGVARMAWKWDTIHYEDKQS